MKSFFSRHHDGRQHIGIQTKLLFLLLSLSVCCIITVVWVSYNNARESLEIDAHRHLNTICTDRMQQVNDYLKLIDNQVVTCAAATGTIEAMRQFDAAYAKLDASSLPIEDTELQTFYGKFLDRYQTTTGREESIQDFLPRATATKALQSVYIAYNPDSVSYLRGEDPQMEKVESPRDNTRYSTPYDAPLQESGYRKIHQKFHPEFYGFVQRFRYEDLMLIDLKGRVVYTEQKTIEFGTDLTRGFMSYSNLRRLYENIKDHKDRNSSRMVDFDNYLPNMGAPSAFVASTIYDSGEAIGFLVLQFPAKRLDQLMAGGGLSLPSRTLSRPGPAASPLPPAGSLSDTSGADASNGVDVYLVGADGNMRSDNHYSDHPVPQQVAWMEKLKKTKLFGPKILDAIQSTGTEILNLPVNTESANSALAGRSTLSADSEDDLYNDKRVNYLGELVISSYSPLEIKNLISSGEGKHPVAEDENETAEPQSKQFWAIVAEEDKRRAFAPAYSYLNYILLIAASLILITTLFALLVSTLFTRPIQLLTQAAHRIARGEETDVELNTGDEFALLAHSFNEMSRSLKHKTEFIEEQLKEKESLLLNILPVPVAEQIKEGKAPSAQSFSDVTVLFAEIRGLQPPEAPISTTTLTQFNELIHNIDRALERNGIEKVKTDGTSYIAVSGLSVPRPDHTHRMVEFALEILRVVRLYNQERNMRIEALIGVHSGPVVGGIVGLHKFIFDIWGETLTVAEIASHAQNSGSAILVTQIVQERLQSQYAFEENGMAVFPEKTSPPLWKLLQGK